MTTFAYSCRHSFGRYVIRHTLHRLSSSSAHGLPEWRCPQLVFHRSYSGVSSASHSRSMQTGATFSRHLLVTATTSVFSLLVVGSLGKGNNPLYISHRNHSDSESDSEQEKAQTESEPAVMQKPEISGRLKRVKEEVVYGMLVGDAVSMPVHWFYNPDDIRRTYGHWLTGYIAPSKKHPSSILNLSAVDGSGRGTGASTALIGNVILHDKAQYWKQKNTHYHQGMSAGDNTLNSVMAVEMLKSMRRVDPEMTVPDRQVRGAVLEDYVHLMTTPGSHNDTYAESFHRAFFKDWLTADSPVTRPSTASQLIEFAENRSKARLGGPPDSQLSVVGALVPAIPWILRSAHLPEADCAKSTVDFIRLTHPVNSLLPFVDLYARLLHGVMNGRDLREEALRVVGASILGGPGKREMVLGILDQAARFPKGCEDRLRVYQKAIGMLGSACYIDGALSSLLFLALEFHDDFAAGVLANANCGGENCHRGAALGALLAAAAANRGETIPAALRDELHSMKHVAASVVQEMNDI